MKLKLVLGVFELNIDDSGMKVMLGFKVLKYSLCSIILKYRSKLRSEGGVWFNLDICKNVK